MERYDVAIVGAGLLGCFAARALSRYDLRILVLEKREDVCTGISRANTGIVYSGYDTKAGTLKTSLTLRGNAGFETLCRELGVAFSRCGSLMIACGPRAQGVLEKKYAQGLENGVPGLALLSGEEVLEKEPNLCHTVVRGLYAPTTGTVNPWELGIAAFENARANGADFHFSETLLHMKRCCDGFLLETDDRRYTARSVINCAGLSADGVYELLCKPSLRLYPSTADYLVLDDTAKGFVRHVVFHEPEQKGKGLTLVPTTDGNLLAGPTERDWNGSPGMGSSAAGLDELHSLCKTIVPSLELGQVIRNFASLRPNPYEVFEEQGILRRGDRSISNFCVVEEAGMISLIGIKTPGLTCAWELGKHVAEKVLQHLGPAPLRADFNPVRRPIPSPRAMSWEQRAACVQADPGYGRVVCRCREVTQGEILEAIRRGATTVDGVKRRTGTGMGRCQGSYCMQTILELLANSQKGHPASVTKDGGNTAIVYDQSNKTS